MSNEFLTKERIAISEGDDCLLESKRNEARHRVLLRARLHAVEQQGDVQVTDLSRSGLRGKSEISLSVGQMVFVSLDDLTHCSGTVRWTQDRRFGLKFCTLLDKLPSDSETDTGNMPSHQERMPRKPTNLAARISVAGRTCSAYIRNISKSGMMLETKLRLTTNQKLFVNLSDGRIVTADVRWVEGDRVGVHLASALSIFQSISGNLRQGRH